MNILKNRTALGLICIVLSLIVCFGLTPLFNGAVRAQTEIVRVTGEINQGDMITANMVTAVTVGGYNLPGSVMKEKENVVGRYAKYDMQAGDYILAAKLSDAPVAEFAYLSELDGTRTAVSVTIKSFAAGLSGKLESGDIVTLIASGVGDFQETIALPELRYVKVLAVTDGKGYDKEYMGRENDSEEKELPAAVTLLALPAQALLLAELENTGKIHCALVYRGAASEGAKFLKIQDDYLKSLAGEETPAEETEAEVRPDGN
ncbi:MAG: Flp pilus assembly protein CpaB [Gracilibacteraceae bacterium]|nr:Flp pilus assembly protein CpaB [Gracilibacteraceae bacterium]